MDARSMNRRHFLKVSGTAAVAVTGIEGILAARQAPAYAQGTKLHWVRWNDFIPESDVELKRQMPEASKALGAEVTLETINANDLQPRITAADSVRIGRRHLQLPVQLAAPLPERGRGRERRRQRSGQGRGRLLRRVGALLPGQRQVAVGARTRSSATRSPTGSRGSRRPAPRSFPKTWDETRKLFAGLKKKGKPYGQTLGHTFGDAPTFTYTMLWAFGGAETDQSGKKVVAQQQGRGRIGEVHAGVLEGMLRRGRPGLGRHQQQPGLPRRRAVGHAERRLDLHRGQAAEGQDQGRQGRAALAGHRPRAAAGGTRRRAICCSSTSRTRS